MKIALISLAHATERREAMEREFAAAGLSFSIRDAVNGKQMTEEQYAQVDREQRERLGLYPLPDASIANWLSQREAMRDLLEGEERMLAIIEDDARFRPDLAQVLALLEQKPVPFDIVILHRRNFAKKFIPCHSLPTGHALGRVKFADYGSEGYVITREAARHFLQHIPRMVWDIDQSIARFWDSGLNVYYVDPPVVYNEGDDDSQIESGRLIGKRLHRRSSGYITPLWRRARAGAIRAVQKRIAFRRLQRGEIGVS